MPTLQGSAVKVDENQLLELASLARKCPFKRGSLQKADAKGKKSSQKWCYIYQNMMFYYETEASCKPLGMLLLEGAICKPLDRDQCSASFTVTIGDDPSKGYVFTASSPRERNGWIEAIEKSSMASVQQELLDLQQKYSHVETQAESSYKEVEHLKLAHQEAQVDIAHLRATIYQPRSRARSPCAYNVSQLPNSTSENEITPVTMDTYARILQHHIRGWLIHRRWRNIVSLYMDSPHAAMIKKRNQLIWRFVATEEDYVSLLSVLHSEYQQQFEVACCSKKPPLTMEQCTEIFRNCDGLLLFHQLFLRGLHSKVEQWPVVKLGGLFRLFLPMLAVYSQYIGNQSHALDVLFQLKQDQQFRTFLVRLEKHISISTHSLEDLLLAPLSRMSAYMQDLQELKAHTPAEHVDYPVLDETVQELEQIQKAVNDGVNSCESFRQVLKVEHKIEGGCNELLDKEQILVKNGFLQLVKEDKATGFETFRRNRYKPKYCFLFSKHMVVTTPLDKKGEESYRLMKDIGVMPLALCRIHERPIPDVDDLNLLGFSVEYEEGTTKQLAVFLAPSVAEKLEWVADIAQCIENETQLRLRHALRAGDQDANCRLHYSDHRSGKERIVSCGNLSSLLKRLVNVSYFGLDFLNTFLMTFPLFTTAETVMDYLLETYHSSVEKRAKRASNSSLLSPDDFPGIEHRSTSLSVSPSRSPTSLSFRGDTTPSRRPSSIPSNKLLGTGGLSRIHRTKSESGSRQQQHSDGDSVSGIMFALKHWICKHYYHFQEKPALDEKLRQLLKEAVECAVLTNTEIRIVNEMSRLYEMQKADHMDQTLVTQYMTNQESVPPRPFEVILLWEAGQVAEQLCLIESDIFRRVARDEMIRYIHPKGRDKAVVAPNLATIFHHFNRMSTYWMWSVAMQRYDGDRIKVIEFLVQLATRCWQLNNYASLMQIMAALEHGTVLRFKQAWDGISKSVKMQLRCLKRLSSADGRYKQLRETMRRAGPPMVPYIGTTLSELVSVSESQQTHMEDDLINFSKMRKYTKLVLTTIQNQKDPYQFSYIPEILKVLLCTKIPGTEDDLYDYIDKLKLHAETT